MVFSEVYKYYPSLASSAPSHSSHMYLLTLVPLDGGIKVIGSVFIEEEGDWTLECISAVVPLLLGDPQAAGDAVLPGLLRLQCGLVRLGEAGLIAAVDSPGDRHVVGVEVGGHADQGDVSLPLDLLFGRLEDFHARLGYFNAFFCKSSQIKRMTLSRPSPWNPGWGKLRRLHRYIYLNGSQNVWTFQNDLKCSQAPNQTRPALWVLVPWQNTAHLPSSCSLARQRHRLCLYVLLTFL